uniref:Uncharacterized protein n=1 Tax=Arundo donax TaxID=35708 RepID=A0A0A9BV23_ARUDO
MFWSHRIRLLSAVNQSLAFLVLKPHVILSHTCGVHYVLTLVAFLFLFYAVIQRQKMEPHLTMEMTSTQSCRSRLWCPRSTLVEDGRPTTLEFTFPLCFLLDLRVLL